MKIVFLSKHLPAEGSTIQQIYLGEELIKKGHKIYLFTGYKKNKTDQEKEIEKKIKQVGIVIKYLPFPVKPLEEENKIKMLFKYIWSLPIALKELYNIKPDIIHVHWPVTSYIASIYRKLTATKFVSTFHIGGIPKHPLNKKADKVIAISSELKEELKIKHKYKEENIEVIFNGVPEVTEFNNISIRDNYKILKDEIVILVVGTLNYRKGMDILIEALKNLQHKNFKVLFVGEGKEEYKDVLKQKIKKNNLEKKIIFCGWQNPYNYYFQSDIFILPSRKEGFPLVVVEAMLQGVTVIRSNTYGAYDQITDGKDGFIFENENVEELKYKITKLLDDEELRKKMSKKAKEKAMKLFTTKINADKIEKLYYELLGEENYV